MRLTKALNGRYIFSAKDSKGERIRKTFNNAVAADVAAYGWFTERVEVGTATQRAEFLKGLSIGSLICAWRGYQRERSTLGEIKINTMSNNADIRVPDEIWSTPAAELSIRDINQNWGDTATKARRWRMIAAWAAGWGLDVSPVTSKAKFKNSPVNVPAVAHVTAALGALNGMERVFVETLATLGLRQGEAVALKFADIDTDSGVLNVRRRWVNGGAMEGLKSGDCERRFIRISRALVKKLQALRGDSEFIFSYRGKAIKPATIRTRIERALVVGGVDWIKFHDYRHFCASRWFMDGIPISQVSQWLGHKSVETTYKTYIHFIGMGHGYVVPDLLI